MTLTRKALTILLGIAVALCGFAMTADPVSAASFKKTTPKFKMDYNDAAHFCSYTNNAVKLYWYKVKGAKKYQIYRSGKKNGKYKHFATVKGKTSLVKKTGGNYWYKIRAIKGKKKTKWSRPIHIIALSAKVTKMSYEDVGYDGYVASSTVFQVEIKNKSNVGFTFENVATVNGKNYYGAWLSHKDQLAPVSSWQNAVLYIPAGASTNKRYLPPGETKYIRVFVHDAELPWYGEDGLGDKEYHYYITATFTAAGGMRTLSASSAKTRAWDNASIATYY